MLEIKSFTFNPFGENTFLLYNEKKEVLIIDPGAYFEEERKTLLDFLSSEGLKPIRLLNTHCHVDHVFGNHLIFQKFGLKPEIHAAEKSVLDLAAAAGLQYNLPFTMPPDPQNFLDEKDTIALGEDVLSILFTPGHSPGSISFYCEKQSFLIGGDVLFRESIGRTDLSGGDHETLIKSIKEKLFSLPDETSVYSGHGPATTIGYEKQHNPFVNQH